METRENKETPVRWTGLRPEPWNPRISTPGNVENCPLGNKNTVYSKKKQLDLQIDVCLILYFHIPYFHCIIIIT